LTYVPHGAEVRAYAVATGAWVFSLVGHGARVSGVAPHPVDAGQVVTSSLDGTLRCWDAETGAARGAVHVGLPVARLAVPAGLPAYAEIEIIEETTSPAVFAAVTRFVSDFKSDHIELLHHKVTNKHEAQSINQLTGINTTLDDLSPQKVLMDMMESGKFAEEEKQLILQAFIHINELDNDEGDDE
jgi:WD40 repeat protein